MKNSTLLFSLLALCAYANAQCANQSNIYAFTFNGKNYEVVKELKTWTQAAACAVQRGGHLVHIDTVTEQNAVYNAITSGAGVASNYTSVNDGGGAAYVWIGATDKNTEGTWLWDGNNDNVGVNFWNGQGAAGANNGAIVGNAFVNWGGASTGTYNEPDNFQNIQDGGAMALSSWPYGIPGEWNDISINNTLYYVIEYENTSGIHENPKHSMQLNIFPNPASSTLAFSLPDHFSSIDTQIFSVEGKLVENNILTAGTHTLDIEFLQPGIYYLRVEAEENIYYAKFIRE